MSLSSQHYSVSAVDELENVDESDDVIPTAIVVKNIPFVVKKEQLLEFIESLGLPLPYAFNYHFDNGIFRGLAFANFSSPDDTQQVIEHLNGKEIDGRKLRVEFKKVLPQTERNKIEKEKKEKRGHLEEHQQHSYSNISISSMNDIPLPKSSSFTHLFQSFSNDCRDSLPVQASSNGTERCYAPLPSSTSATTSNNKEMFSKIDFNDPDTLEIYSQLLLFRDRQKTYTEIVYPIGLSPSNRDIISSLCVYLNLIESSDPSFVIIKRSSSTILNSFDMMTNNGTGGSYIGNSHQYPNAHQQQYQQSPLINDNSNSPGQGIFNQSLNSSRIPSGFSSVNSQNNLSNMNSNNPLLRNQGNSVSSAYIQLNVMQQQRIPSLYSNSQTGGNSQNMTYPTNSTNDISVDMSLLANNGDPLLSSNRSRSIAAFSNQLEDGLNRSLSVLDLHSNSINFGSTSNTSINKTLW